MTKVRLTIYAKVLDYKIIEEYIQSRHHFKFIREYPSGMRRGINLFENILLE